ncbi:DUF6877 family protein [Sporosarcina sp. NCCP-2716]|uniref:DUF6877 family protein n=1 Tax=Sporosarcina sp. NCCP-2716 TaxID=2943679 RepID=UPI0037DA4EAF
MREIAKISHKLPLAVLEDIDYRVTSWLAGGGKETDPYIHQQLRFALNAVAREERMSS